MQASIGLANTLDLVFISLAKKALRAGTCPPTCVTATKRPRLDGHIQPGSSISLLELLRPALSIATTKKVEHLIRMACAGTSFLLLSNDRLANNFLHHHGLSSLQAHQE